MAPDGAAAADASPTLHRSQAQPLDPCAHSLDPHGRDAEKKRAARAGARAAQEAKPNGSDGGNGAKIMPAQPALTSAVGPPSKSTRPSLLPSISPNELTA